jgi:hypothetical protein
LFFLRNAPFPSIVSPKEEMGPVGGEYLLVPRLWSWDGWGIFRQGLATFLGQK